MLQAQFSEEILTRLTLIYEDLIWLASRSHVTPRQARAWYSQVLATSMASKVRKFSGKVSKESLKNINGDLCLEHFNRLSFALSSLIEEHIANQKYDPSAFVNLIEECEQVNITTLQENQKVKNTKGDYNLASVELVDWNEIAQEQRQLLWQKKLKGNVSNARDFC